MNYHANCSNQREMLLSRWRFKRLTLRAQEKNYNKTIVGDVAGMKLKTVYSKAFILSRITNTLGER